MEYTRIQNAIDGFISYAKIQGIASNSGDSKIGNQAYNGIVKAYNYLKKEGAIDKIKYLLSNNDTSVKLWAACYLLQMYEEESLKVLEEIAKGNDIYAFSAKMTIEEFKKGNLSF